MSAGDAPAGSVYVTGGSGYLGRQVVESLADEPAGVQRIVSADVRDVPESARAKGVVYERADVRDADFAEAFRRHETDTVVHLAAIVTPGPGSSRELEHQVDVVGTRRVLEACAAAGVRRLVYTSSGAAYGYHADNAEWLSEDDPLRGNVEFAYSDHKRQVEEMLAEWRARGEGPAQLVFRPGAILGEGVRNQITALFEGRFVLGLRGAASPFNFVWDQDVVGAIGKGVREGGSGIYNLAGDGILTTREIAGLLGKPYLEVPPGLVRAALALARPLGLSQYGPEQVVFLQHRPVLANRRLKEEFGYVPRKTTREVFDLYLEARRGSPP